MNPLSVCILQARCNSSRYPSKVLADICGVSMLAFQIQRVLRSELIDKVVIATTNSAADDPIRKIAHDLNVDCFSGDEHDVLSRYYFAAKYADASNIIRITGDCPLVDPLVIDDVIRLFYEGGYDYCSNCLPPTFPDGFDVEVFTRTLLEEAYLNCSDKFQREHVTPWMQKNLSIKIGNFTNTFGDMSSIRLTVDEPEDMAVVRSALSRLDNNPNANLSDILALYESNKDIFMPNKHFSRNEGHSLGAGQKLWRRAKKVIPGGNMLLSKRPEMFLPDKWPAYFSSSKGCKVWDLDGNELIDMSIMGIGTNILGYGCSEVDNVVAEVLHKGNMSTLNCPEEVLLAERLVDIHKWADMVRFARSGGEANSVAIRIARAATGRDTVAICGYHGWHDWYLATNLKNESGLEEHLLPGLEPNGVPQGLAGTVQPFSFNRLDQLEKIATNHKLAAVKMEVQRTNPPNPGFLEGVRQLCTRLGIVLIFDECTSGFRETFGGLHLKYGVEPDMAMFGKALGNGYAITAVIGRREVMDAAQSTFISSTFWTERIGPTAALKTLEVMERERSWEVVTATGLELRRRWQELADRHGLRICHSGLPALTGFSFQSPQALSYKTLITQEMLKKGFLAATSCYVCVAHKPDVIDSYLNALDEVFGLIAECESGRSVEDLLEGPVCHGGFKRLN